MREAKRRRPWSRLDLHRRWPAQRYPLACPSRRPKPRSHPRVACLRRPPPADQRPCPLPRPSAYSRRRRYQPLPRHHRRSSHRRRGTGCRTQRHIARMRRRGPGPSRRVAAASSESSRGNAGALVAGPGDDLSLSSSPAARESDPSRSVDDAPQLLHVDSQRAQMSLVV
jgi:hypothetical protein